MSEHIEYYSPNNETVIINARGVLIEVYKSVLLHSTSPFFRNLLVSNLSFAESTPREDGSYFIDCDEDVLRSLLSYMEFGLWPTMRYNPTYLKAVCDKFAIDYTPKIVSRETRGVESAERTKKIQSKIENDAKVEFLKTVDNFVRARSSNDNHPTVEVHNRARIDPMMKGDNLILFVDCNLFRVLSDCCASNALCQLLFEPVVKPLNIYVVGCLQGKMYSGQYIVFRFHVIKEVIDDSFGHVPSDDLARAVHFPFERRMAVRLPSDPKRVVHPTDVIDDNNGIIIDDSSSSDEDL